MTYGVVKVTYDSHLDMIPTLKEEEKAQIYAWLVEAREFALDAENSNKKHAAFGKYKGRINNYLTKRGYDLKKEREEWVQTCESTWRNFIKFFPIIKWLVCLMMERVARRVALFSYINSESDESSNLFEYK